MKTVFPRGTDADLDLPYVIRSQLSIFWRQKLRRRIGPRLSYALPSSLRQDISYGHRGTFLPYFGGRQPRRIDYCDCRFLYRRNNPAHTYLLTSRCDHGTDLMLPECDRKCRNAGYTRRMCRCVTATLVRYIQNGWT